MPNDAALAVSDPIDAVAPPPRSGRRVALLGAALVGIGLRAWIAWGSHLGIADGDEAISAGVAWGVLHGHLPAFYPGQSYGGTGEEVLIAGAFRALGSSTVALRVVPVLLGLLGVALTWRIGRRTVGEPAARIAAGLAAIWPLGGLYWSTRARGFYGVALVLCLSALLLALRIRDLPPGSPARRRDWVLLGFTVGVAWWTSPLCTVVIGPTLLWLAVTRRPRWVEAVSASVAALAGMVPWLVWNVGHRWGSLAVAPQMQPHNGYVDHLVLFARRGLPLALGLRAPLSAGWPMGAVLGTVAAVAAVVALVWVGHGLPRSARVVALLALAYPFLLALSPYSYFLDDTRYLYLLQPLLALLVAAGLVRHRAELAGLAAALALTLVGLVSLDHHREIDVRPLAQALDQHHLDHVAADYWVAYPLEMATDGRIVATPLVGAVRSRAAADRVRGAPEVAMVWTAGSWGERRFERRIGGRRVIDRFAVGGYDVFVLGHDDVGDLIPRG